MKVTGGRAGPPAIAHSPQAYSDPLQKHRTNRKEPRRKIINSGGGVRLRKDFRGASLGRRSRPETPLLQWKFNEGLEDDSACVTELMSRDELDRTRRRKERAAVSVRKLAAGFWRLQLPEVLKSEANKLGFLAGAGHIEVPFYDNHHCKVHDSPPNDPIQSQRDGFSSMLESSFRFSITALEGATKWDPISWKAAEVERHQKFEAELEEARARIQELETERRSSKKKLEQFLKKLSEERAAWRSREHEKIRAILDESKAELKRERTNRQRLEIVNFKLVNELAHAKLSAKRYMQDFEKEQRARELIEEVCDELANEIGEDKAEIEALKQESAKLHEEVDEERKMLQMAEVWREERVQMKLVDAKVMLEDKYSQMNQLIADLESFLSSDTEEMKQVNQLRQAAAHMTINDIHEFNYEPPNAGDLFSVFEDIETQDVGVLRKSNFPRNCNNQSDGLEEDGTEWETVDEQGSSYSPDEQWSSAGSSNSQITRGMKGCIEWPRASQKNSLKAKLLEARLEGQKVQLRHVLKQKI